MTSALALAEAIAGKAIDEGERPGEPEEDYRERPGKPEGPLKPEKDRPTISEGDGGPHVQNVQMSLGIIPADGDFGGITEGGVKGFQAACGLTVDGVVGPKTWAALDDLDQRKRFGDLGLTNAQIDAISDIAQSSAISRYSWEDRNVAPTGYIMGMACCFALALVRLQDGDPAVEDMAQADRNNSKDSLTWYEDEFKKLKMDNSKNGVGYAAAPVCADDWAGDARVVAVATARGATCQCRQRERGHRGSRPPSNFVEHKILQRQYRRAAG